MSLTSQLQSSGFVRGFFLKSFPFADELLWKVNQSLESETPIDILKGSPPHYYAWVGTAFDYRARYYLGITPLRQLVAWSGSKVLEGILKRSPFQLARFWQRLDQWLMNHNPQGRCLSIETDIQLNSFCLILAKLEVAFRAGPFALSEPDLALIQTVCRGRDLNALVRPFLKSPYHPVLQDLSALSKLFWKNWKILASHSSILNPTFDGSSDVGGADADIIIANTLIDLKCIKTPLKREALYQILGYKLLDYSDRYKISRVGFYFGRHGIFKTWSVKRLVEQIGSSKTKRRNIQSLRLGLKCAIRTQNRVRAVLSGGRSGLISLRGANKGLS